MSSLRPVSGEVDYMYPKRSAFTLVEILVVLAIIGILAALLFPVFNRARESGRQAHCASNLKQIYMATRQYYDDEKRYPASIQDLLPEDTKIANLVSANSTTSSGSSTGYLKGGSAVLRCLNDDTDSVVPRCSYGNTAAIFDLPSGGFKSGLTSSLEENTAIDPGRYVWNYWGYDSAGWAYIDSTNTEAGGACSSLPCDLLRTPANPYDRYTNPIKYSLSNRFAPPQTIVSHCIYHRTSTSNARYPGDVGNGDANLRNLSLGARDIVLRLDGSTKTVDVSAFQGANNEWQQPSF